MQKFRKRFPQEVCLHFILSGFSLLVLWDERPGKRVCLMETLLHTQQCVYFLSCYLCANKWKIQFWIFKDKYLYYFCPFFRVFDRDYTGRTLVNVLIFVNVTLSHQAHVAYFVLNDLTKVNRTRKMCLV